MLGFFLVCIFVSILLFLVILEVRNEKKYQKKRRQTLHKDKKTNLKKTDIPQSTKKTDKKTTKLPNCTYPKFTHTRLIEMGLSNEEAQEFVKELIPQLEIQIPLIEKAFNAQDFHQMEHLTHSIKGSATNLGTGGVADLLVECNTYLKTGTDIDIAKAYFDSLKHYTQTLKEQYA